MSDESRHGKRHTNTEREPTQSNQTNQPTQLPPPTPAPKPYLVKVEDNVELADVAEELVQELHKQMDGLQVRQLVVRHVHPQGKVQARVPPVNQLAALVLHKVGVLAVPAHNQLVHVRLQTKLFGFRGRRHVPLGQPGLALPVLEEEEADLVVAWWVGWWVVGWWGWWGG